VGKYPHRGWTEVRNGSNRQKWERVDGDNPLANQGCRKVSVANFFEKGEWGGEGGGKREIMRLP